MKRIVLCLSLDSNRTENEIGRGGVYGATAAIFLEGIPFPGRKIVSLHVSVVPIGRG